MKFIHKNRHFLMMTAGCVAMLVAAFALTSTTSGGSWGFYLLLLLCPAMHILMHRGMHSRKKRNEIPQALLPSSGKEVVEEQAKPPE
jgi:membrane protein DedA with SNARE-associated domain